MPISISALAGLFAGMAAASVGLYHVTVVGPRLRAIARTLTGDGGETDVESVALLRAAFASHAKRADERLDRAETLLGRHLLRLGFVRYNSFSDVGSDQSFTLALLNTEGDGIVVTSIFGRDETRTYGKSVRAFVPQQGVSREEQAAIEQARTGIALTSAP